MLCEGDMLTLEDFPQIVSLVDGFEAVVPDAPQLAPAPEMPSGQDAIIGVAATSSPANTISDGSGLGINAVTDGGHIRRLEEIEKDMIRLALHRYRGQMSQVARKLGLGGQLYIVKCALWALKIKPEVNFCNARLSCAIVLSA